MALARVKEKFQITLPVEARERARFSVGDLVDVTVNNDVIELRVKRLVDRDIAEGAVLRRKRK